MSAAYEQAQAEQRLAADPLINVFVTANAGSGKTKVLIDRIARLLLTGVPPDSFLCITYTKAAASEMQRRLFERLGAWCVMGDDRLGGELNALVGEHLKEPPLVRARALFARALETPGGLKIQTIHAFCERLLRRFPLESGVAPGFTIADEARAVDLVEEAWLTAARSREARFDEALDHLAVRLGGEGFADLRARLMKQRTPLTHQLARGLEGALSDIDRRHGVAMSVAAATLDVFNAIDFDAFAQWRAALEDGELTDRKFARDVAALIGARDDPSTAVQAYRGLFFTGGGEPRQRLPPTKALDKKAPGLAAQILAEAQRAHGRIGLMRAAQRRDDARSVLVIAHAMMGAYRRAKDRAGVVDFDDLVDAAKHLLTEAADAQWVLYKLDAGIEHILIDEGQDTSPDQWDLLAPLQREFFAGAGAHAARGRASRTVFAVGDPKQSIYGFQGAEPARFEDQARMLAAQAVAAGAGFAGPSLAMSFRSTSEVLAAVDATLSARDVEGQPPGMFNEMRHVARREGETGLVEWWPLAEPTQPAKPTPWDAPVDQERGGAGHAVLAEALAKTVRGWIDGGHGVWDKGVLRPMRAGDVMVLVRSRGPMFQQVLRAFKRAGLAVAGADRLVLAEDGGVQDLLALARVAIDPHDDLSLACVLKSPFVGLLDDDEDIFPLAYGRAPGESVFDRLQNAGSRYDEARRFIAGLIARRSLHPHAFFSAAIDALDGDGVSGLAKILARLGHAARDPIEEFMGRALNASALGVCNLHAFVHRIQSDGAEVKRQLDESGDAISVMTVHGAKGLERPVAILPQTAEAAKVKVDAGLLMQRDAFAMVAASAEDDAFSAQLRADNDAAAQAEHLRLLYVAMTRARDRLIVCGYLNGNQKEAADTSWHRLVGDALAAVGAPCETPFGQGVRLGEAFILGASQAATQAANSDAPDWLHRPCAPPFSGAPDRQEPLISPRRAMRARLLRGRLIHGLLQRLPDIAPAERANAGAAWLARQSLDVDLDHAAILVEAMGVLDTPDFAAVFGPGSRAEAPILVNALGARRLYGVVDRLLIEADRCIVVDYKTDRPPPETVEATPARILQQMAAYRAGLRAIFPGRAVQVGLIWTLPARLDRIPDVLLDRFDG